jgi:hypothetical protein
MGDFSAKSWCHQGSTCVTTWTKFDTTFSEVGVDTLLEIARPKPEATRGWSSA